MANCSPWSRPQLIFRCANDQHTRYRVEESEGCLRCKMLIVTFLGLFVILNSRGDDFPACFELFPCKSVQVSMTFCILFGNKILSLHQWYLSIYNLGVLEGLNTRAFWFALTLQCTQITNRVFLGKLAPDFKTNILMVQVQLLLSPSVL